MRLIDANRLTEEIERNRKEHKSELIKGGLTIAASIINAQPAVDPLDLDDVRREMQKRYQQGYLDGTIQQQALGIK